MKWTVSHVVVVSAALVGCGSIWGFEDPIEVASTDGGLGPESGLDPAPTPGFVCVPPAPEGWDGPLAIFEATAPTPPPLPDCTDKFTSAFDAVADPKDDGSGCTCACEPDGDYTCAMPLVSFFVEGGCATPCGGPANQPAATKLASTCVMYDRGTCGAADYRLKSTDPKVVGNPCKPKIEAPPAPYTFTAEARLCRADLKTGAGVTCAAGAIAAPAPILPFNPGNLCIASKTAQQCPPGYPTPRTYYDPSQVSDERKCVPCTCGDATGSCAGTLFTADKSDCTGNTKTFTLPLSGCSGGVKSSNVYMAFEASGQPANLACGAPAGGGMTGEVMMGAPLTICCRL